MTSNTNQSKISKCGLTKIVIFLLALFFGTGVSIWAKIIMTMPVSSSGGDNTDESTGKSFQKPLFLTFNMFVGMLLGLLLHWIVLVFHIPFPGYDFNVSKEKVVDSCQDDAFFEQGTEHVNLIDYSLTNGVGSVQNEVDRNILATKGRNHVPVWMYFYLAIPAIFDFAATIFGMVGLQYLDASVSQFLRGGSGLIFVALMKQYILKDHLYKFHWVGVAWIVISVATISLAALLLSTSTSSLPKSFNEGESTRNNVVTTSLALLGMCQTVIGTFFQACQYVSEEHVMRRAIPAPPLLLIGMEGLWGTALCIFVMFPVGYYMPGDDNGSYEDPFSTWDIVLHSRNIQVALTIDLFFIFLYNLFAVLVTFFLCSVWHAMLDNFRLITVWVAGLIIFYFINPQFGEVWTKYSYLQIVGLIILVYGTAIYNAPNGGSLRLEGQWWALGIDLSKEYDAILKEREHEVEVEAAEEAVEDTGNYHRIL